MTKIDVLLVTALKEEQDAFITISKAAADGVGIASWEERDSGTATPYLFGRYIGADARSLNIALARPTRMGGAATSPIVATLAERLKPRCIAMCGVCAGNPAYVALGDVVIAEMVYEYDEGKRKVDSFEGDHRHVPMLDTWVRAAQEMQSTEMVNFGVATKEDAKIWLLERLYYGENPRSHLARSRYFSSEDWTESIKKMAGESLIAIKGREMAITDQGRDFVDSVYLLEVDGPEKLPFAIKVGPMASGNVVVKDGVTWDNLKTMGVRSVLGLEMEAATIGNVAHRLNVPHWVVAKGVMDHADPNKDDRYKGFAARASAEVLIRFLLARLGSDPTKSLSSKTLVKKVFVIGGVTEETNYPDFENTELASICARLGEAIAKAGAELLVCSLFPDSADIHSATAYVRVGSGGTIHFHSPRHPSSREKLSELKKMLGRNSTKFVEWCYPGPENEDSWSPAWLLCQLQALETADVVVAIGGRLSNTTSALLHIAEARRIPIVPFEFFGGAAKRAFDRIDWERSYPNVDYKLLLDKNQVGKVIEIANQLVSDRIVEKSAGRSPTKFFVSRARLDSMFADAVCNRLKLEGFVTILGDDQVTDNRMVQPAIEDAILSADVCIVLWSESYAKSRWCYDELHFAMQRAAAGALQIWLFNIDGSDVVPAKARTLPQILTRSPIELVGSVMDLIARCK